VIGAVQSLLGSDPCADIGVTPNTAELRFSAADLMAVGAMSGAVQKLMLASQRPRRDLCRRSSGKQAEHDQQKPD